MAITGRYEPMNVWHAYEASLRLCFSHIPALLLGVAVAIVPSQALLLILQSATMPDVLTEQYGSLFWQQTPRDVDIPSGEITTWITGLVIGSLVVVLGLVLATAAACVIVAEGWHGRTPTWRSAWAIVGRRAGPLAWLTFVGGLLVVVGLLLCILPGIWLGIAWSVAVPALLFEEVRGTRALERSFRLVRHRWWPTFGGLLLISATGWLLSAPFAIPGFFIPAMTDDFYIGSSLQGTLGILSNIISTPITAALVTVFFFDLRARHELAATLPPETRQSPPPPPQSPSF
jgi:hypothetical protein